MTKQYIYGIHAVTNVFIHQPHTVRNLFLQENRDDKKIQAIIEYAKKYDVAIMQAEKKTLEKFANDSHHQGVVAEVGQTKSLDENDFFKLLDELETPALLLILDGIQDPHNLGACLRSADAAGVTAIIAPKDNAVSITPLVRKVACGAAETAPFIQVTNLARFIKQLKEKNIWVYGLTEEAQENYYNADLKSSIALILGAEGKGMRRLTKESCDVLYHLPMHGTVSSLNVSVTAGIVLFEVVRQRIISSKTLA